MSRQVSSTAGVTSGRLDWVDPAKGLAIFMVIAYHVTLYLKAEGVDAVLGRAKAVFELFPMPAFFLIAGLFAARHGQAGLRALWKRRLLPLLYLYVVWSVLRTVFYFLSPHLNGELGEIPATDPLALLLVLVWPSSSYWFLWALLVFTLLRWLIARLPAWVQLVGSGVLSGLVTSGLLDTPNIGWDRVGALFFFFVLGAVHSRRIRDLVAAAGPVHAAVALAAMAVATALIVLGLRWVPFVVLVGQLASVAVGILVCRYLLRFRLVGVLSAMGAASLKLYLLHLYIIATATALIGLLDPAWPRWIDVLVQVALTGGTVVGAFWLARATSRVRWLYVPPSFLRGGRPWLAKPRGRRADPVEAEAGLVPPETAGRVPADGSKK